MKMFDLTGKTAVLPGGSGVLGSAMAMGLAEAGANVVVCSRTEERAKACVEKCKAFGTGTAYYQLDAMDKNAVEEVCDKVCAGFGQVDILVNMVGGNIKEATTNDETTFFELDDSAVRKVFELNIMGGAVIPCQVFGKGMVGNESGGVIINISSMASYRPLTRTAGYSAAKAAVNNLTQWLATDMAKTYGEKIRVNAIAPGFFLTDQNRYLLTDEKTGEMTARGRQILDHTPMGRYGNPEDLVGALIWLASDASKFVTGVVIPVDGGFSAYSGV